MKNLIKTTVLILSLCLVTACSSTDGLAGLNAGAKTVEVIQSEDKIVSLYETYKVHFNEQEKQVATNSFIVIKDAVKDIDAGSYGKYLQAKSAYVQFIPIVETHWAEISIVDKAFILETHTKLKSISNTIEELSTSSNETIQKRIDYLKTLSVLIQAFT